MPWIVDYFERADDSQAAEVFEDDLDRRLPKLAGKLARIAEALETSGPNLGGGLIEPCRGYGGMWEIRAIFSQSLAREFFGFDGQRAVLLHGYVKRAGQAASTKDLALAFTYWQEYLRTRKVSPEADMALSNEENRRGNVV
jgi:hypothetical protein